MVAHGLVEAFAHFAGKSLNQAVRDHLEQLAGREQLAQECEAFVQRCLGGGGGQLNGWKFNREEANARR